MKRFAFRLERIRELRARAERERAADLGAAMREEHQSAELLAAARRELERTGEQAAAAASATPQPAGMLRNLNEARDAAEVRVEAASAELEAARERVAQEQERYGEARRELRVVEKLREKRLDAWREDGAREERKETDEVATNRHFTKEERS